MGQASTGTSTPAFHTARSADGGMGPAQRLFLDTNSRAAALDELSASSSKSKLDTKVSGGNTSASSEDATNGTSKPTMKRKRDAAMTAEEQLKWSRQQSRDHSRRSRLRRKQLEENMRCEVQKLSMFRALIEESGQLISLHSTNFDATFTFVNQAHVEQLHYQTDELIGTSLLDVCHPADQDFLRQMLQTLMLRRQEHRSLNFEWRILLRHPVVQTDMHSASVQQFVVLSSTATMTSRGLLISSSVVPWNVHAAMHSAESHLEHGNKTTIFVPSPSLQVPMQPAAMQQQPVQQQHQQQQQVAYDIMPNLAQLQRSPISVSRMGLAP